MADALCLELRQTEHCKTDVSIRRRHKPSRMTNSVLNLKCGCELVEANEHLNECLTYSVPKLTKLVVASFKSDTTTICVSNSCPKNTRHLKNDVQLV